MQCDCLTRVTEKLTSKARDPEFAGTTAKVECAAVVFTIGATLDERIYIPFRVTADKTGYRSQKGKEVPVYATYCPFCGKLANPPKEGEKDE